MCATAAGECTLRAALETVSNEDIQDRWVIEFDQIPTNPEDGREVARIQTGSELDLQGSRVQIRGDTAPGWQAGDPPIVYIDGSTATGPSTDGLELNVDADTTSIIGLGIVGFPDDGINIVGSSSGNTSLFNTIQYCWIGIEPDESTNGNGFGAPNFEQGAGIDVNNLRGLTIGAMGNGPISNPSVVYTTGGENVIGGNAEMGIYIEVSTTASLNRRRTDVVIANNFIGLLPDGTTPRGNGTYGIKINDARDNYIGWVSSNGDTFRNYFAGNGDGALFLNTNETEVTANYFGITADASSTSSALAPGQEAILITRPSSFGNNDIGFQSGESRSSGKGNVFGGYDYGIRAGTGNTTDERADNENIRGNYFGVSPSGASIPLGRAGVYAPFADSLSIVNNVFGNIGSGQATDAAISLVNVEIGIHRIFNNIIGASPDGTPQPIDGDGIYISGGRTETIEDNIIGNATGNGITVVDVTSTSGGPNIERNSIGSTPAGADIGNGLAGIEFDNVTFGYVEPTSGGDFMTDGNLIAFNGGPGVAVTGDASRIRIRGNVFRNNGGPMIDLGDDGDTPNDGADGDADTGPNKLLNTPEVVAFDCQPGLSADQLMLTYRVRTTQSNANFDATDGITIDLYAGSDPDNVEEYLTTDQYTGGFTNKDVTTSGPNLCDKYLFMTTTDDRDGSENNSTSEFLSPSQPLPVELTRFDAVTNGDDGILLTWQTASETNNAGFEVQRRTGSQWDILAFVEGAGTTDTPQDYRFRDTALPFADSLVYRLRQVDTDGTEAFSDPVVIQQGLSAEVQLDPLFPNPVRHQATVRYVVPNGEAKPVRLQVYNILGQRVATLVNEPKAPGREEVTLDTSGWASGTYFLRLQVGRTTKTQRISVVR